MIEHIARLDADVISIEASRSGMELLDVFRDFDYPGEIGPGVYDIHSPRVPSVERARAAARAGRGAHRARPAVGEPGLRAQDPRLARDARPRSRNLVEAARRRRAAAPAAAHERVLDRLPALATTGVGSLPFDDPADAARHAARRLRRCRSARSCRGSTAT